MIEACKAEAKSCVQINEAVTKRAAAQLELDAAKPDSAAASKARKLVEYYSTKVQGLEKAKTSTLPCEFDFSAEVWPQLHCTRHVVSLVLPAR